MKQFEVTFTDRRRPKQIIGEEHFAAMSFWAVLQLQVGQTVTHRHYRLLGYKQIERVA